MDLQVIFTTLFEGLGITVLLFAITLLFSLPLGLLISFGTMSKFKPLKWFLKGVIWVIRSTPLMLQVLAVSCMAMLFGVKNKDIASFFGMGISSLLFFFAAIAFVLNYSCYFAEIFRGGIESINKGQTEAGFVLGMTKRQIFFKVTLLQVVKRIVPPMSNEIITLVKDTSIAQIIGVVDLLVSAKNLVNTYVSLTPLLYAAIFYLIFNGALTLIFGYVEKKLSFYKE